MDAATGLGMVLYLIIAVVGIFISIVWIVFPFIVNSRLAKLQNEIAEGNQEVRNLVQEATKANQQLARIIDFNKKQASTPVTRKTAPVQVVSSLPPLTLTISKDGENIGEYTLTNVKQMLKTKQLSLQDMYFDTDTQEWTTLELLPSLY
jgi:cell division protein FtsL